MRQSRIGFAFWFPAVLEYILSISSSPQNPPVKPYVILLVSLAEVQASNIIMRLEDSDLVGTSAGSLEQKECLR